MSLILGWFVATFVFFLGIAAAGIANLGPRWDSAFSVAGIVWLVFTAAIFLAVVVGDIREDLRERQP